MRKLIFLVAILLLSVNVMAAYYVTDPANCPTSYQSQTCSGSDVVCGSNGGVTFCYDPTGILPPTVQRTTSSTNYNCQDGTCDGGFVIDCTSYDGSAPHCDNGNTGFCDRESTCYNKHVQTDCTANLFVTSSCSANCISGWFTCDGSSGDADGCEIQANANCGFNTGTIANGECYSASAGNCTSSANLDCNDDDSDGDTATCNGAIDGCEIDIGGACTIAGLPGTYASTCSAGDGICQLSPQDIATTGELVEWSGSDPMLWLKQYGVGPLFNFTDANNVSFLQNTTGVYWNDSLIGSGGDGGNSSWNQSLADTLYYSITNPFGFYNITDFDISDYFTASQILGFGYYNASDFDIADYYLKSNPFGFYNITDFDIGDYWTGSELLNGTLVQENTNVTFNNVTATNVTTEDLWVNGSQAVSNINISAFMTYQAERTTVVSDQYWAVGNGAQPIGSVVPIGGTLTNFAVQCNVVGTSLPVEVRKNGVDTGCNVTVTTSANTAYSNTCNVAFETDDLLGVYAKTETGVYTTCVATAIVSVSLGQATGLKGDKGDSGDVTSPAGSIDNAVCRFNGTSGDIIQNSGATIDDLGNLATTGTITAGNLDVDTLNFNGNVISDSTGTISFDNENLTTTGTVTATSTGTHTIGEWEFTSNSGEGVMTNTGPNILGRINLASDGLNSITSTDSGDYNSQGGFEGVKIGHFNAEDPDAMDVIIQASYNSGSPLVNITGDLYVSGDVDADSYTEHSVALELPEGETAFDKFTLSWEERSYLNENGIRIYNHTNRDDVDLLLIAQDIIECDYREKINQRNQTVMEEYNCTVVGQTEKKDLSTLIELQREAIVELNKNMNLKDNLTEFNTDVIAEKYHTNTTKDTDTMTKISNFRDTLKTKTFQQITDFVLTPQGRLSTNILFNTELSEYGSYELGAIGHFNRAMIVFLMKENLNQQEEIEELRARTDELCEIQPSLSWCSP